jgi:hypothetical protein
MNQASICGTIKAPVSARDPAESAPRRGLAVVGQEPNGAWRARTLDGRRGVADRQRGFAIHGAV